MTLPAQKRRSGSAVERNFGIVSKVMRSLKNETKKRNNYNYDFFHF